MLAVWIVLIIIIILVAAALYGGWYLFRMACSRAGVRKKDGKDLFSSDERSVKYTEAAMEAAVRCEGTEMEDVWQKTPDGLRLHARFYPAEGRAARIVLCAHGYRSGAARDFGGVVPWLHDHACHVLLIDERAHGQSRGRCITFGAKEKGDILQWVQYLDERFSGNLPIYLYGLSMGASAVLLTTALGLPESVSGVVADCGYSSAKAVLKEQVKRTMRLPAAPLLLLLEIFCRLRGGFRLDEADALAAMEKNSLPVLFFHGTRDTVVPVGQGKELYEACRTEKKFYTVEGAEHAMAHLLDQDQYQEEIGAFFARCEGRGREDAAAYEPAEEPEEEEHHPAVKVIVGNTPTKSAVDAEPEDYPVRDETRYGDRDDTVPLRAVPLEAPEPEEVLPAEEKPLNAEEAEVTDSRFRDYVAPEEAGTKPENQEQEPAQEQEPEQE